MRFQYILSALAGMLATGALVDASPMRCPDSIRDGILKGEIAAEKCCSYGKCLGDVVIQSG